jgi:hypothetical protein
MDKGLFYGCNRVTLNATTIYRCFASIQLMAAE